MTMKDGASWVENRPLPGGPSKLGILGLQVLSARLCDALFFTVSAKIRRLKHPLPYCVVTTPPSAFLLINC